MGYLRGKNIEQSKNQHPYQIKGSAPLLDGINPCPVAERDENIMC